MKGAAAPVRSEALTAPAAAKGTKRVERVGLFVGGLFRHVSVTILLAVGLAAGCGLAALWLLYDMEQDAALIEHNERTMRKLSESVIRGLESVMLQGSVEAVESYAERLKTVRGISELRVLRTDGVEAFHDNKTVAAVNARLGSNAFRLHDRVRPDAARSISSPHLEQALRDKRSVTYYETDASGVRLMTHLHPLLNEPGCQGCHGDDHAVRGVLKVTTSLQSVERTIRATRYKTLAVLGGVLALILVLTYALLKVVVVRRVQRVSNAMHAIVLGDYSTRVPDADRDELGEMARSFNRMAENLLAAGSQLNEKRDMMTAVLRGAHDGIVVADRKGDIVMANAAAEQLLGKSSQQIHRGGLPRIFDNPALIQAWRASLGDVAEEITYRNKPLQVYVSHIRGLDNGDLGIALLMRDISGERALREEVKRLHFTDPLTGLGNARYLEHALAQYSSRAKAAQKSLAVALVSVDTLKDLALSYGSKLEADALKHVAHLLAETFGSGVPLARTAEDTLAAVLYGASPDAACGLVRRALERIHATPLEGIQLWASAGVAAAPVRAAGGQSELIQAAARALRDAIEAGSGSVRAASPQAAP